MPSLPLLLLLLLLLSPAAASGVFRVRHKYGGSRPLADLRAHDARRHARILSAADLPLGGLGSPADTGLYFAEIGIGTPAKSYYVQVDTGSDIMWVNCASCRACPRKSDLKIELVQYDLKGSGSGDLVMCDQGFCTSMFGEVSGCTGDEPCQFKIGYGDGSETAGYFVSDILQYDRVSGDHQTTQVNATITFGCATELSGDLVSSNEALDGIIGFGQSNSSMISQLASSGKVRKIFAHCLDSMNGGGIFAIGHVVQPKVNTTPLVPNMPHYNVNLKSIDVGGTTLQIPTNLYAAGDNTGTIIDSGTTLAYLPDAAYRQVVNAILSTQSSLNLYHNGQFTCFRYTESVDDGFPNVSFHFENSLVLVGYPHDYLFELESDHWCIGWQNAGKSSTNGGGSFLLGDILLSNKLVIYDLEKQVIGWTDYNCSSSIKVQDDKTGAIYTLDAQNISSANILEMGRSIILLLTTVAFYLIHR